MPTARREVARGALRGARAAVLATAALALAATAHVVGGGTLPSLPVLALVVVPLAWGAVALTSRPLGRVALAVGLGAAQVLLHEALMVLSGPSCAPGAAAVASPVSGMAGMHGGPVGPATICTAHAMHATATSAAAAMLVAHAVATLLTALVLAHGEGVLVALLTVVSAPLRRVNARTTAARVPDVRATLHPPTWPDVVELASAVLDAAGGRRGPPVTPAAALAR